MIRKMYLAVIALGVLSVSCSDDDDATLQIETSELTLNLSDLDPLGDDFVYEGWIIVDGAPVSTGRFSDVTFPQTFQVLSSQLASATTFVLSIEPTVDPDPAPAATKVLSGDFSGSSASVNSNLVADFSTAAGTFILATPTDMDDTNEESGVWFLDNASGSAVTGLNLPELADGWKYEGWAVIDGTPISTGTFTDASMADDNAATSPFKGDAGNGPGYPGEDYLQNAPAGFTFPTDLRGTTIVVSVEPSPDNSAAPFTLKPLLQDVAMDAAVLTSITMGVGPVQSLMGTVNR
ncbi:anti-sigma factor [Olleya sp. HaHaR_3_96]|uniref:anti-sigma factor n=1 Tax=Olleya sp. HaHaR_3_96 TaxID=2745560 RepID=UPI001C4EC5C9|nr:anti-sigma factor [Olleya sp. HaHaR_3_96]QXP61772.1 anti-sigma factor [Olleya sp. HaHaR_3_96]